MRTEKALAFFNGRRGIAAKLSISHQAVYQWGPVVPYAAAIRLAELSGYQLHVERDLYDLRLRPIREKEGARFGYEAHVIRDQSEA